MEVKQPLPEMNAFDVTRFWLSVRVGEPGDCWEWRASTRGGYGRIKIDRADYPAHRLAYFLQHCEDPGELLVCHTCDNPLCCNGAHLFLGTTRDNAQDREQKGRSNTASGLKHGSRTHPERFNRGSSVTGSKLNEEQVREIRRLHAADELTIRQLAARFGITYTATWNLLNGRTWKHLK